MGSLPIKYLGVPLLSTNLTAADCKILIDNLMAQIKSWTNRFLSFAGRLQLIHSVLSNMQNYWANLFILPKRSIKQMEKLIRSFLWSGIEHRHTGAKVAWADLNCPKSEGGLGIRKIEDMNKSLMASHIWEICQPISNSTWVNWVKVHLIREHSFWEIPIPSRCSWTWWKLLSVRIHIRPLMVHRIGNGLNTMLWFDNLATNGTHHLYLWG